MLTTIIKREIMDYLMSAKFQIGLAVTLILMIVSTSINVRDYVQRHQDYLGAKDTINVDPYYGKSLFRPPQVLSVLIQGKDSILGNRIDYNQNIEIPIRPSGYMGEEESLQDRFLSGFRTFDFAFVVRIVLSLMAIFLAYDAVSGEKAHGTLKASLANHLPRDVFLNGKLVSGLIVVLGSLSIGSIACLLLLALHPGITLVGSDWLRIVGLLGSAFLYIAFFYVLGLFVSVKTARPSEALMILLQAWVLLVFLYPQFAIVLAENVRPLPDSAEIIRKKEAASVPYREELHKLAETKIDLSDSQIEKKMEDYNVRLKKIMARYVENNTIINQEYNRKMNEKVNLARLLSILSPAVHFDSASERLARTDISEFERFMTSVFRYKQLFDAWKANNSDSKGAPPDFSYASESVSGSVVAVLPSQFMIFIMAMSFYALAYVSFLKKDLR